jgi:light-regulated signal transduction histidine kinase (bacteriophytochrome)
MDGSHARLIEEDLPTTTEQGERAILTTKAPWRDSKGSTIGLVAIAKDITTRKAYQRERDRLLCEVRRANEELSAFSHVVAHDLRTPLRAVKLYAELLAQHLQDRLDDTARQIMTFVREGAEQMEQLIESLLRYAESGEELDLRRVNVNNFLDLLMHRLEPLIRQTKAQSRVIRCRMSTPTLFASCNSSKTSL